MLNVTTSHIGNTAENRALTYLQQQGLVLLDRNYKTPGRGGGEIDLIMIEFSPSNKNIAFTNKNHTPSLLHTVWHDVQVKLSFKKLVPAYENNSANKHLQTQPPSSASHLFNTDALFNALECSLPFTLVFVEVRYRKNTVYGNASATVDAKKQARIAFAAQTFLKRFKNIPPCRFDVITFDPHPTWFKAAFGLDEINPIKF